MAFLVGRLLARVQRPEVVKAERRINIKRV
jgi:hypothetical protein